MRISDGTRLGPYEILAPIGAGGMGEVYRARDTRLDRTVAVKVLPESTAAQPDVQQRFEREARAVSSLNHPNICNLFDIGRQDGVGYLVMEYLEGETLAERLEKGPLPIDQALRAAIDIASALEAAHRHGVIHRDLKPANVMLTPTGPKVLDFGLAKVQQQRGGAVMGDSLVQTLTTPLTGYGTIVGTLQYMAPEQLEGKEADTRTDLFAFGALLYEMLTGRRAFEAASHAALISTIMMAEPAPVSAVQPLATPALDHVVRTCLAKNPDDRWQTAHDLMVQLKWAAGAGSQAGVPAPVVARRKSRDRVLWAGVAVLTVALAGVSFVHFRERPAEVSLMRFQVPPPPKAAWSASVDIPALSPDGRKLVFAAFTAGSKPVLWLRSLDTLALHPLAGTDGARLPFWSPDSRFIGFFADEKLKKIDLTGGAPQTLCDVGSGPSGGASWSANGTVVFGKWSGSMRRVPSGGGESTPALPLDPSRQEGGQVWPWFLPDGRHFLYYSRSSDSGKSGIFAGALDSKERRLLLASASNAAFAAPGLLLFGRQQSLMAQPFDPVKLQVSGEAFPIAEGVGRFGPASNSYFSVSANGVLAWRSGASGTSQLVSYSRDGRRLASIGAPRAIRQVNLSPDGNRLALEVVDLQTSSTDIWLADLASGIFSRVTYDPARESDPVWSPEGRELVFTSSRAGPSKLYRKVVGGPPEELFLGTSEAIYPAQWLRDGSVLFLNTNGKSFSRVPLSGDRKPETLFQTEFDKDGPTVSPDGHWVAYNSIESGSWEVYLASFPAFNERRQISNSGGIQPRWGKDGKELYYITLDGQLMVVDIKTGASLQAGIPRALFRVGLRPTFNFNEYDVTRDGSRFFVLEPVDEGAQPVNVTLNFTAGLSH